MKNFVIDVIRNLDIGLDQTRISVIRFSFFADVIFYLDSFSNVDDMIRNITAMDFIGSETNTSGALRVMNDIVFTPSHGDRPDIHNIGIVITDGQSNANQSGTIPEAVRAKNNGVRMFVIGLTNQINADELQAMSSQPLQNYYFNRTTYALVGTVVSNLVWSVCHDPCVNVNATGSCMATQSSREC